MFSEKTTPTQVGAMELNQARHLSYVSIAKVSLFILAQNYAI